MPYCSCDMAADMETIGTGSPIKKQNFVLDIINIHLPHPSSVKNFLLLKKPSQKTNSIATNSTNASHSIHENAAKKKQRSKIATVKQPAYKTKSVKSQYILTYINIYVCT